MDIRYNITANENSLDVYLTSQVLYFSVFPLGEDESPTGHFTHRRQKDFVSGSCDGGRELLRVG